MASQSRASAFIDALLHAESHRDIGPLVALFGPESELRNPTLPRPLRGREGAEELWTAYVATFREIRSEFRLILETEQGAALEWTSRGSAPDGKEIVYEGVSILELENGSIRRFRAYFDPRSLGAQLGHRPAQAA
jgi:ketosteroid isomerase-like protein